jgi:hypothetical protein
VAKPACYSAFHGKPFARRWKLIEELCLKLAAADIRAVLLAAQACRVAAFGDEFGSGGSEFSR